MSESLRIVQGNKTALGITAATVIQATVNEYTPARIVRVHVTVAGTTAGAVYDATSTSGNSASNQIAVIPNTVGSYLIDTPCLVGLVVVPGSGQTLSVVYE